MAGISSWLSSFLAAVLRLTACPRARPVCAVFFQGYGMRMSRPAAGQSLKGRWDVFEKMREEDTKTQTKNATF